MKLTSPAFTNNEYIPSLYSCLGKNINPPFSISDIPQNTISLALLIDDPDAPIGDWVHWLVFNIDPVTKNIPENSIPANSVIGLNSSGQNQYEGPCPPSGTHHYHFKIYALDSILNLDRTTTKEIFLQNIHDHIIDQNELVGLFTKK
ncbi:MAG: YbhB/YbcL family Raf kinase inhibitor-like protein [Patescibacteria group bacterium]